MKSVKLLSLLLGAFLTCGLVGCSNSFLPDFSGGDVESTEVEKNPNETEGPEVEKPEIEIDKIKEIYNLALKSGYSGTYEEWLDSIKGDRIELRNNNGVIEWKYSKDTNWIPLLDTNTEKITHTITFDVDGNKTTTMVQDGRKITKPADPVKLGYLFDGWYVDNERWSFIGYIVTEDLTLTAKFIPAVYEIDIDLDNGEPNKTIKAKYNEIINIEAPVKEGYDFLYWIDSKTNEQINMPFNANESINIKAVYKKNLVTETIEKALDSISFDEAYYTGFNLIEKTSTNVEISWVSSNDEHLHIVNNSYAEVLRPTVNDHIDVTLTATATYQGVTASRNYIIRINKFIDNTITIIEAKNTKDNEIISIKGIVKAFAYGVRNDEVVPIGYYLWDETGVFYINDIEASKEVTEGMEYAITGTKNTIRGLNYLSNITSSLFIDDDPLIRLYEPIEADMNELHKEDPQSLVGNAYTVMAKITKRMGIYHIEPYNFDEVNNNFYWIEYFSGNTNLDSPFYAPQLKGHENKYVTITILMNTLNAGGTPRGNVIGLHELSDDEIFDLVEQEMTNKLTDLNLIGTSSVNVGEYTLPLEAKFKSVNISYVSTPTMDNAIVLDGNIIKVNGLGSMSLTAILTLPNGAKRYVNYDINCDYYTLTARVKLPNGEYLKNFKIQWSTTEACFPPTKAKDGVASKMFGKDDNYYPHIMDDEILSRYAYNLNGYIQNKNNRDAVIELYDLNLNVEGSGTKADPFKVSDGGVRVQLDRNGAIVCYSFMPKTTGTYVFESVVSYYSAIYVFDPALGFNGGADFIDDGGVGKNFRYELECTAGVPIEFMVTASSNDVPFPNSFDMLITPKTI